MLSLTRVCDHHNTGIGFTVNARTMPDTRHDDFRRRTHNARVVLPTRLRFPTRLRLQLVEPLSLSGSITDKMMAPGERRNSAALAKKVAARLSQEQLDLALTQVRSSEECMHACSFESTHESRILTFVLV